MALKMSVKTNARAQGKKNQAGFLRNKNQASEFQASGSYGTFYCSLFVHQHLFIVLAVCKRWCIVSGVRSLPSHELLAADAVAR